MTFEDRLTQAKNAIAGLTALANDATGAGDANIADAVMSLLDGYGKGGDSPVPTIDGHKIYFGEITPTEVGGFTVEIPFKTDKIYFGCIWLSDYDLALNHQTENIMLASTWRNTTEAYASIYYMMSGKRDATYKSGYGFRCNPINPTTVRVGYNSYPNWPMQTEKYYYMFVYDGEGDGQGITGIVTQTNLGNGIVTVGGMYDGLKELHIATTATAGLKINVLQDLRFTKPAKLKYIGAVGFYGTTSQSDIMRGVFNASEVDFGGVRVPATTTRWFYARGYLPISYLIPCVIKVKGLIWDDWTSGEFGMGGASSTEAFRNLGVEYDIDWNGTVHNRSISFGGGNYHMPLTKNSMVGLFNALDDDGGTINLGANNLSQLTDEEKAIATSKGWTLS